MSQNPHNDPGSYPSTSLGTPVLENFFIWVIERKTALFTLALLVALCTFLYVFFFTTTSYKATIKFMITDNGAVQPEKLLETGGNGSNSSKDIGLHLLRLQSFGFSQEALLAVAESLELKKHYNLPDGVPLKSAADILFERIDIDITPAKEIIVSSFDFDMEMAGKTAHGVLDQIDKMHKDFQKSKLDFMQEVSEEQRQFFDDKKMVLLDSLNQIEFDLGMSIGAFDRFSVSLGEAKTPNDRKKLRARNRAQYVLEQLKYAEEQVGYYENQLIQHGIARKLIDRKMPLVLRETNPQRAQNPFKKSTAYAAISQIWFIGLVLLFYWLSQSYNDFRRNLKVKS